MLSHKTYTLPSRSKTNCTSPNLSKSMTLPTLQTGWKRKTKTQQCMMTEPLLRRSSAYAEFQWWSRFGVNPDQNNFQ